MTLWTICIENESIYEYIESAIIIMCTITPLLSYGVLLCYIVIMRSTKIVVRYPYLEHAIQLKYMEICWFESLFNT